MKIRRVKNTAEKFRNRIAKMQTDNRGLTLIELIITVAIVAIFSGVVLTFITTGSNTYRSTSSSAKVQMETQELIDRMEDMIIDTNRSLYYANGTGENIGSAIKNDIKQSGAGNSDGNKTFIVCNEYKNNDGNTSQYICDVIDWDKEDATVYYSQREYTATSSSDDSGKNETETAAFSEDEGDVSAFSPDEEDSGEQNVRNARTKVNRSVLATGILDFRADVTKVESDNIVCFQLSTENGKKEIETLHSVSLRNKVKVKKPADSVDDTEPTNVGIRISYAPASMDPGASDRLAYDLSGNGSIDPSTITWSVVSDGQNGSFPGEDHTNSRLTINGNASGSITVKVSAKTSSGKWIESAPVTIQITAKVTPAPTEAPEPTATPVPTSTPVPTATPVPTRTPVPTPVPTDGEIILDDNSVYDTVVPLNKWGNKTWDFTCTLYSNQFHLKVDRDYDFSSAEAIWSLKDNDSTVRIDPQTTDKMNTTLHVDVNSKHGFTLVVDYTQYKTENNAKVVDYTIHAERSFNVISDMSLKMFNAKGEEIQDNETIKAGEQYTVKAYLNSYDVNGNLTQILIEPARAVGGGSGFYLEGDGNAVISKDDAKQGWTVIPTTEGQKAVVFTLQQFSASSIYNPYDYNLTVRKPINVKIPEIKAELVTGEPKGVGQPIEVYLKLTDEDGYPVDRTVNWICYWGGTFSASSSGSGDSNKVTFTPTNTGELTINAQYLKTGTGYDTVTISKKITIS
ncbi:prepilin-type N-terminal cleavage/methylation domain-containing protein [Blautia sp.]|uniref:prepilin-type N-terminal cleavage/methylation domain-containing protein n=1 Tax=Blautia sp. TaxID=1955243 RepID=UPI003AF901A8